MSVKAFELILIREEKNEWPAGKEKATKFRFRFFLIWYLHFYKIVTFLEQIISSFTYNTKCDSFEHI